MADRVPTIFSPARRQARRQRLSRLQQREDAARFVMDDMVEDVLERLAFLREEPATALVVGDYTGTLEASLGARSIAVTETEPTELDEEHPYPFGSFDFIASLGTLDTVNDLPGALIHLRNALSAHGLVIASFPGAGSLPNLRRAMLAAEEDRPAARMHPLVDVRAAAQLLQRAGWADPVVDSHSIRVSYRSLDRLVMDLREQGLGSVLASAAPPLTRAGRERASEAFMEEADEQGRVVETFEILTLSGRRPAR
jgi:SAM-dependent methyltransferase